VFQPEDGSVSRKQLGREKKKRMTTEKRAAQPQDKMSEVKRCQKKKNETEDR
jgi:hypothetical protein